MNETLKWVPPLPVLMQNDAGDKCQVRCIVSLFAQLTGYELSPVSVQRQSGVKRT